MGSAGRHLFSAEEIVLPFALITEVVVPGERIELSWCSGFWLRP